MKARPTLCYKNFPSGLVPVKAPPIQWPYAEKRFSLDGNKFLSSLNGLPVLAQSQTDIVDTIDGDEESRPRYYHHPERPPRHLGLGYAIVFGPIMLIGGLYYISYAFRHSDRLKEEAALFYLTLGVGGILSGIAILLLPFKGG